MKLPALRSLLEDQDRQPFTQIAQLDDQDRQLFSQIAQNGTPETAAYLLSRHSVPEDYSRNTAFSDPTANPIQYLACRSASIGNAALFRYLLNRYPTLISTYNRNVENILVYATDGGVSIWKIILEHDPRLKDYEFGRHRGCVLELVLNYKRKELLEFLLKEGADTDRAGDPVLEMARLHRADSETMELIKKYSV